MGQGCPATLRADGTNFTEWWIALENFLATKGLKVYLTNPAPAGRTAAEALLGDDKALGFLRMSYNCRSSTCSRTAQPPWQPSRC